MNRIAACAMAAFTIAAFAAPAVAAESASDSTHRVSVDLAGLDLTTADGRAGAQQRIETAVALYCTVDDASSRARAAEARCKAAVTPKMHALLGRLMADPATVAAMRRG